MVRRIRMGIKLKISSGRLSSQKDHQMEQNGEGDDGGFPFKTDGKKKFLCEAC